MQTAQASFNVLEAALFIDSPGFIEILNLCFQEMTLQDEGMHLWLKSWTLFHLSWTSYLWLFWWSCYS